jgi:RNA polymerase sigma factor (sigma-70 family)
MPPPAEGFAARLVLGPALRAQPDRRLVTLVREGYESAFEEIVRRYGKLLTRYAAAIVGSRGEDVTQDAFSKALLALRRNDAEIELRPWLFRIVRNTALNDLRDSPPTPELLAEAIAGGESAAEVAERREELTDLMRRLRSLPEAQRAAIVMREMEGLSHEEIAAALGVSGGGARQAIHRARQALRNGAGMLVPLPLLEALLAAGPMGTAEVATAGASGTIGAGVAFKAVAATVLVAGAVGAGVAVHDGRQAGGHSREAAVPAATPGGETLKTAFTTPASAGGAGRSGDRRGHGGEAGDDRGHGRNERGNDHGGHRGTSGDDNSGSGPGGRDDETSEPGDRHGGNSGPGSGGGDDNHSGHGGDGGSGPSGEGDDHSGESSGHGGDGPSGQTSGSGGDGGGSSGDDLAAGSGGGPGSGPGPSEPSEPVESSDRSGGPGPGPSDEPESGGTSGSGSGSSDSLDGSG